MKEYGELLREDPKWRERGESFSSKVKDLTEWLTGTELNVSSMMGMVMIVGNVTELAIFYMSEYVSLPADTENKQRLIDAAIHRMRAITMTTVAAILALLPLALGIGQGSAMLQPLAIAIIAGLFAQLPLVLVLLPALLALFGLKTKSEGESS